jgi:hypothetical protein
MKFVFSHACTAEAGFQGRDTLEANSKPARHAIGGVSFVMKIFAYQAIRKWQEHRVVLRTKTP